MCGCGGVLDGRLFCCFGSVVLLFIFSIFISPNTCICCSGWAGPRSYGVLIFLHAKGAGYLSFSLFGACHGIRYHSNGKWEMVYAWGGGVRDFFLFFFFPIGCYGRRHVLVERFVSGSITSRPSCRNLFSREYRPVPRRTINTEGIRK